MRKRCPVAHSEQFHWSLLRHADVLQALNHPSVFSNQVSEHLSVPNGMDQPEHTHYRRLIDPYFSSQRMEAFEPACRQVVLQLLGKLPAHGETEFIATFADIFAVQAQCAFLEWPVRMHQPLLEWTKKNHAVTRAGDREGMSRIALEFDGYIRELLHERRSAQERTDDAVSRLLRERVYDRPLSDEEIVSILRTWTVGELSTISACVGIAVCSLAQRPRLQQQLRDQPALLPTAIDELLRIDSPFIASRRITKEEVQIGKVTVPAGARISLIWASANRDEAEFGDPDEFRLDRDPAKNLLYGAASTFARARR